MSTPIQDPLVDPTPKDDDEKLREPGLKALQAEREAREQAEKSAKALQDQLDAIAAEKLTDEQKRQKATEDALSAQAGADAARAAAEEQATRWRFAAVNGVPTQWVDRLQGATEEELAADWEALKPTLNLGAPPVPKGTHVPGVGNQPPAPASLDAQISAAQAEGDAVKVMSLKAAKLAELTKK